MEHGRDGAALRRGDHQRRCTGTEGLFNDQPIATMKYGVMIIPTARARSATATPSPGRWGG
jgi:hypothetical protein